ncbi:hypothetical protein BCT86_00190 [Vibrio breoganii]|uniref:glycosyltransferase n=1 Tax=Vibrio breoganii TaxID=553239 RepID=UPI000C829AB8|nr:hypothetical protein BCT86_00190 [Vibrio breoganii]
MISISIVTYNNNIQDIKKCLNSFLSCSLIDCICIYENSEYPLLDKISIEKIHQKVIYISDPRNFGYGYGHNKAFSYCQALFHSKYHLVMNLDVDVSSQTMITLVNYMEASPTTLQCMPKVLNPDQTIQRTCKQLPTPINLMLRRFFDRLTRNMRSQKVYEVSDYDYSYILNCPYLSGCFMMVRSQAFIKVGMFDTRFFMYPEDIDLTRRLHKLGNTECYPFVSIVHQHARASYSSYRMTWIHIQSMFKYFNKWGWFEDNERKVFNKNLNKIIRDNLSKH